MFSWRNKKNMNKKNIYFSLIPWMRNYMVIFYLEGLNFAYVCLFVCIEVYGPVKPCQARSIHLTTLLLGRFSPLSS